jgi:hypothetical protein
MPLNQEQTEHRGPVIESLTRQEESGIEADQAAADGEAHEAGHVVDAHAIHQADTVKLDGFDADLQTLRHFLRVLSFGDELENGSLALGEAVKRRPFSLE